jgi:hypothetical protein
MILPLLLILAAAPERLVVMDETVEVPAAGWRAFEIDSKQRPAVIECRFAVASGGSGVRVSLLTREDRDRLRDGQRHRPLASTPYRRSGAFRLYAPAGEYSVIVSNALEGRGPARVRMTVALAFPGAQAAPQVLSPGRRVVVVALSLLFFAAVALFAGRRILRAWPRRPSGAPPPAFWA